MILLSKSIMKYVLLNNGVKMPMLGFGTWDLRGTQCTESVINAINVGYRLIDTAQMYKNEKEVGNALRNCGVPREELFITTKVCSPSNNYQGTKQQIEKSLEDLQLDYIDLFLIHEPYKESLEMYKAMKEYYESGKIKAIGVSNFNSEFYTNFIKDCGIIPAINQVESHIFYKQKELQKLVSANGTVMEAWAPFAAGQNNIFANETLKMFGLKYGKSVAQIALRVLIQNGVIAIPKTNKIEKMKSNLDIFDFEISDKDMKEIDKLDGHKSLYDWTTFNYLK